MVDQAVVTHFTDKLAVGWYVCRTRGCVLKDRHQPGTDGGLSRSCNIHTAAVTSFLPLQLQQTMVAFTDMTFKRQKHICMC